MSREIDLTKPLSDEDRAYLEARARHREIAEADGQEYSSLPDDSIHGAYGLVPDAINPANNSSMAVLDEEGKAVNPDGSPATLGGSQNVGGDADGDNYDDTDAWSYADIQSEVGTRRDEQGDAYDGPALSASREDLVAWLRSDDAA